MFIELSNLMNYFINAAPFSFGVFLGLIALFISYFVVDYINE